MIEFRDPKVCPLCGSEDALIELEGPWHSIHLNEYGHRMETMTHRMYCTWCEETFSITIEEDDTIPNDFRSE